MTPGQGRAGGAGTLDPPARVPTLRRLLPGGAAIPFAVAASVAFLVVDPPVGDFWAARARASAALHGVGLHYWFSWFGGTVPGHYSVLTPFVSRVVGPALLGALSTITVTSLVALLVRGSRHPAAATWLAAFATSLSLWSGRVPFAFGSALMVVALLAVRSARPVPSVVLAVVTTLVSPVSGAFLALGVTGLVWHDRRRRPCALATIATVGACLLFVVVYFATPGPEGFQPLQAWFSAAALAVLLLARPPAYLRSVVLLALVACPIVALVPNGLGSNFERFAWICLPVAVLATGRAPARRCALVAVLAVASGVVGSVKDLWVATQPMSRAAYVAPLAAELDRLPDRFAHRVEVVPDGTHVTSYALLGHALLARGFETQADNAYAGVLGSPGLDPAGYRAWLDENAVGWVALDRHTLAGSPEDTLVRTRPPAYLHPVWGDAHWQLFAVDDAVPVVTAPARVETAGQAQLQLAVPRPGRYRLLVRWSTFLTAGPSAVVQPDGRGWTVVVAHRPGRVTVRG